MRGTLIKLLETQDAKRRVAIVLANGLYTVEYQYRYRNMSDGQVIAEGWASLPGTPSYYADVQTAEREAHAQYPWLAWGPSHTGM